MFSYIFGMPGSGAEEYIYEKVEKDIAQGVRSFILVPEQYSLQAERNLIATLGFKAQRSVQVLTFSRLSNMVFSALGPLRMRYIDSAGKNMLVARTLQLMEGELEFFKKNIRQQGFSNMLVTTFSEFKRYGVTEEGLKKASENIKIKELSKKLSELGALYGKYNELLQEKNADAEDDLSIVIPKLGLCDFLEGELYVNHFKSFTPLEEQAVFQLMKKMNVTFSFVSDNPDEAKGIFRSSALTLKKIKEFADKNGIELGEKVFLDGDKKHLENPELCFLKENYLSFCPLKYQKECENIRLLRPRTYYDEVEAAARNILHLCRTKGFDFEDFLILTPDGDTYRDIIPVVFEKFGIDVFVDSKKTISSHVFVRFLRLVLEILAKGFSYERIMGCIRSGFFDIERRHQDIFENYLLASGVANKHYIKEGDFTFNPDEKRFDLSLINSVKKKSVDQILGLEKSIRGRKSAEQICVALYLWLEKSGIKTTYEKMIDALMESNDIDAAKEFETVWNSVMAVFSQFEEIFTDTPMTYQRVFEIFSVCTDNIKTGGVPSFLNQVHVYDTDKFISADKKVVMVLGVSENTFPKSFSEDGLISDAERELLSEGGMILAPLAYEKQYDEQFMVYSVLSSPKEMLFLSSPLANSQGEAIESGEVFDTLKKIFTELKEEYTDFKEDEIFLEGQDAAFGMLYNELCEKNGNIDELSYFWQGVYNYFVKEDGFKEKLEELEKILKSGEEEPKLSKKAAEKLYGKPMMMSVSRLEKYNGCAFSYFLTYGLFIDQRQKASFEASDKGTALHDVLCKYFEKKKAENADYSGISFDEVAEETAKIVDESSELKKSMLYETSSYYRYEIGRLKSVAAKTAWKIVKFYANSSFRPYGFEIKIGKDGEFPPYIIRLEDTEVSLRGFIDRMDICDLDGKKYFNIVDYKSSEKKIDLDLLRAGVRFQPLIYAGIVKENIKNSDPGAMLYMHMNDPVTSFNKKPDEDEHQRAVMKDIKVEGLVLGEEEVKKNLDYSYAESGKMRYVPDSKNSMIGTEEMNELLKGAMECAKETAEKIKEGNIEVNPLVLKDFDACKYCKFSSCCGINMD